MAGICRRSRYIKCGFVWIYSESMERNQSRIGKKNNVRDFATINELTVLSNLESHNAQMKYIQTFLSVLKFKHLIGAFVSQFLSCIGIDMTHHKVNLFLRVLSDIFSFWNNPAYHLMVVFATVFLIGGTGIAVEHPCAKLSLGIAFDSGRIGNSLPLSANRSGNSSMKMSGLSSR